jgi:hypothetical protein
MLKRRSAILKTETLITNNIVRYTEPLSFECAQAGSVKGKCLPSGVFNSWSTELIVKSYSDHPARIRVVFVIFTVSKNLFQ